MVAANFSGIVTMITFLHTKTKDLNVFIEIKVKSFHLKSNNNLIKTIFIKLNHQTYVYTHTYTH